MYLFSLECFSQILPDQQADILFDNIQYLSDTSLTVEEQAENLHVFMISGWGSPGSASAEDFDKDPQNRRSWTCWCAAHRPQMTAPANLAADQDEDERELNSSYQNIIILEFELERDTFNPLYPPPAPTSDEGSVASGVSSPSDASVSASASNSSGRTLVSQSSEEVASVTTPEDSPNSLDVVTRIVTDGHSSSTPSTLTSASQVHSVIGEEAWLPTAEDILESTTSRSKPLLALERLRRTRRAGESTASESHASGSDGPTRGAFRRRRGTGAVGMMDVFAVMAQINEQLGAAPDLDSFLKVTAGVMKDLTQFHRVLLYQFDEAWNGQVVAELVDWNQTHDLYRGLHFPATDIPAQVRYAVAFSG